MVLPTSIALREAGLGWGSVGRVREGGRGFRAVVEQEAEDAFLRSSALHFRPLQLPAAEEPRLLPPNRAVNLMVLSPDGATLASAHVDHRVYVTELGNGRPPHALKERHSHAVFALAFHPANSALLASGCTGGLVCIWSLRDGGSEALRLSAGVASLAFHPLLQCLAVASADSLVFWDWDQAEPFAEAKTRHPAERLRFVGFDQRGSRIFTGITNAPILPPEAGHESYNPASRIYTRHQLLQSYRQALNTNASTTFMPTQRGEGRPDPTGGSASAAETEAAEAISRRHRVASLAEAIQRRRDALRSAETQTSESSDQPQSSTSGSDATDSNSRPGPEAKRSRREAPGASDEGAGPSSSSSAVPPPAPSPGSSLRVVDPETTLFAESVPTASFDAEEDIVREDGPSSSTTPPELGTGLDWVGEPGPLRRMGSWGRWTGQDTDGLAGLARVGRLSAEELDAERRRRQEEVERVSEMVREATEHRDRLNEQLQRLQQMSQRLTSVYRQAADNALARRSTWSRSELRLPPRPSLLPRRDPAGSTLGSSPSSVRFDPETGSWRAMDPWREGNALDGRRRLLPPLGFRRRPIGPSLVPPRESEAPDGREGGGPSWRLLEEDREERGGGWRTLGRAENGLEGLGALGGATPCSRLRPTVRLQQWEWAEELPLSETQRGVVAANVRLRNDNSLAFSADGQMVACMTGLELTEMKLQCLSLRDVDRGRVLYQLQLNTTVLACLAFSPTDSHLLVGLSDGPECAGSLSGLNTLFRPFARAFRLVRREEVLQPPHSRKRGPPKALGELKPVLNLKRSGAGRLGRAASADLSALLWLRTPGHGFAYASRKGFLTLISQRLSEDAAADRRRPEGLGAEGSSQGRPRPSSPLLAVVSSLRRRLDLQSPMEEDEDEEEAADQPPEDQDDDSWQGVII